MSHETNLADGSRSTPGIRKDDLDGRILRNSGWVAVSHGGRQALSMLSVLVLVRLLEPEAFGLVALAWTFLLFIEQVQGSGLGAALIYRRTDIERAASSALVFAAISGLLLYALSYLAAPFLARAFDAPDLVDVLRVLALILVIRGLAVGPGSILERNLDFRSRAKSELSAGVTQVSVSIGLAFAGAGVWSLVIGHIAAAAVQAVVSWLLVPWRPSPRQASWRIFRELIRYGRFVSATAILELLNRTLDNLIVGRILGTTALGFYSVTYRLAVFPNSVIAYVAGRVMFPVYSMLQDDLATFRRAYVHNLQRNALLALPVSVALVIAAEPIVLGLLGEKWVGVITPLRILAVYALVKLFVGPCGEVFKGAGKPHLGLVLGFTHVLLFVPALLLLTPLFQLTGAAIAVLVVLFSSGVPALVLTMRLLELRTRELGRALAPSALCSALLGVSLALLLPVSQWAPPPVSLAVLAAVGSLVYLGATAIFARSVVGPMWFSLRSTRT